MQRLFMAVKLVNGSYMEGSNTGNGVYMEGFLCGDFCQH